MVPFVLPSIFKIAETASNEEFVGQILPYLKDVMKLREPVQVFQENKIQMPRACYGFTVRWQYYTLPFTVMTVSILLDLIHIHEKHGASVTKNSSRYNKV